MPPSRDGDLGSNPGRGIYSYTFKEATREADTVIMITAKQPKDGLTKKLQESFPEVYTVGDCASPRGIGEAVYEAHKAGRAV